MPLTEERLILENRCWECFTKLIPYKSGTRKRAKNRYECPDCGDEYYSCYRCEKQLNHPISRDSSDNDKGWFCTRCGYHFCVSCESSGKFNNADEFFCEDCDPITEERDYGGEKRILNLTETPFFSFKKAVNTTNNTGSKKT